MYTGIFSTNSVGAVCNDRHLTVFDLISHVRVAHAHSDAAMAAFTFTSATQTYDLRVKTQPTDEISGLGNLCLFFKSHNIHEPNFSTNVQSSINVRATAK